MQSPTEYAYLAGIIDGEGYVGVGGSNHGIVLCMADVQIIYWCHEHFGGTLSDRWKLERTGARSRRMWGIRAQPQLRELIPHLLPYAVLKREELVLCLAYSKLTLPQGVRRHGPYAAQHLERDRLHAESLRVRAARKAVT